MSLGVYKIEHKQGKNDAWENYLIDRYKETKSISDRDALIDFYFTKYEAIYAKIRNKLIIKEITKEAYLTQIEQMIINGFQIGVDLGFARQISQIEINNLIDALTNAFEQIDTSKGEITDNIIKALCIVQIDVFQLFREFYDNHILLEKIK